MSITDELRECIATAIWQYENDVKTAYIPKDKLTAIADRIDERYERGMADAELGASPTEEQMAELGWVKLPVDADGVPIKVGDELEINHNGAVRTVESLGLFEHGWTVFCNSGGGFVPSQTRCHHVQPDSWERIIEDAANFALDTQHTAGRISLEPFVERCRRLAGEGA